MSEFVNIAAYTEEIEQNMPHFVFYRRGFHSPTIDFWDVTSSEKDSKVTDCYCTACHMRYEDSSRSPENYKHKKDGVCANCGAAVQYRQMNLGRQTYYYADNFAVFEGAGDQMRISCIKARQSFIDGELEPSLDWEEITRYELEPRKAVQFRYVWQNRKYCWIKKKSRPSEPNFATGFYYHDHNYTLINHEAVSHSFLRYLFKDEEKLPSMYIQWLCRYAEHPQLEYFLHAGLWLIAQRLVEHRNYYNYSTESNYYSRIRFNWRSNDLKKILHLTKPELEYFMETSGEYYGAYIFWRKSFFQGKTPTETIKYFAEFHNCEKYIKEIQELSQLSSKKIMDYTLKRKNSEGSAFFLICWRDYLRDCTELKYDMQSMSILMPKDLFAMHERVSHILENVRDTAMNTELQTADLKRKDLECVDMELGLALYLPRSVKDIAREGAELSHCVGGYAERHAQGKLTIMFLRTLRHPGKPYYTMEVANDLHIVQCRGYMNNHDNNPKPPEIEEFERRYTEYLAYVKAQRRKAKEKAKRKVKRHKVSAAA